MPTYEYRCPDCGHEFELFQRMSDEAKADCPACGKPATRRMSGGAGFLFKGSGFYITDYRSDSYKKAAGSEAGGEKAGSDKGTNDRGTGDKAAPAKAEASASESKPAKSAGGSGSESGGSSEKKKAE
jgi:putative FmdB family regulatory protein